MIRLAVKGEREGERENVNRISFRPFFHQVLAVFEDSNSIRTLVFPFRIFPPPRG